MFIKSNKNDEEEKPLVLFCNPNAVFYEFIHYQTEWFHFYVETLGADLVIFNYRGYGRSGIKIIPNAPFTEQQLSSWKRIKNFFSLLKMRRLKAAFGLFDIEDIMADGQAVLKTAIQKFAKPG